MFVIEERSLWSVLGAAAVAITLGFGFNALLPAPAAETQAKEVRPASTSVDHEPRLLALTFWRG